MSAPVAHGYADWNRSAARADVIFVQGDVATFSVIKTYGSFFIGNAHQIVVSCNNSGPGHIVVNVRWGFDDQVASSTYIDQIVVRSGGACSLSFPAKAPWVEVDITPTAANTEVETTITAATTDLTPDSGLIPPQVLVNYASTSIGAGATRTDNIAQVVYGDIDWFVFSSAVPWQANLETIDQTGAVIVIDIMNSTQNPARRRVYVPAIPLRIRVTNQTASSQAFTAAVIARDLT